MPCRRTMATEGAGMFGWLFKRRGGAAAAKPSLDAAGFDAAGYELQGEPEPGRVRVWHTPEGDGLGLYFFPIPPDLPRASTVDDLAAFYRGRLGDDSGGKL